MVADEAVQIEVLESDVVVIGGGGTGLAAAVSAADKGAKVILLEKQALGGNTALAQGLFAADSEVQKQMRVAASKDELFKKAMLSMHWETDPRIVRTFINKSGDTIEWLEDKGIIFQRVISWCRGQFPPTLHSAGNIGTGAEIVKALKENAEQLGVKILTRCPAKEILTDKKGRVIGVLATTKEKSVRINAPSVIIGSGGYAGNRELLKKYAPYYSDSMKNNGLSLMGDGLLMAMDIGAATDGLGILLLHPPEYPDKMILTSFTRQPTTVWVNKRGERFTDEALVYLTPECSNVVERQLRNETEKCIYVLFDETTKNTTMMGSGRTKKVLGAGPVAGLNMLQIGEELESEAAKGKGVKISDNWGEIADWIGADPAVFRATIEEYNSFCDHGYDEAFIKDREYLQALRTPPYYALKCYLCFMTTIGGIKINHHMEVLNSQYSAIPGLYAGGDITGGWQTNTYCSVTGGAALGFAINSGRIAGENAADYVLND